MVFTIQIIYSEHLKTAANNLPDLKENILQSGEALKFLVNKGDWGYSEMFPRVQNPEIL